MNISLLHISDLHYSYRNYEQSNYLRNAFFDDLRRSIGEHGKPNAIIFSGDVVHNPDEEDVYLRVFDDFIDTLSTITGVPHNCIVLCPGNHDISFSALRLGAPDRKILEGNLQDVNYFCRAYESGSLSSYAYELSKKYFEFCEYMDAPWDDPFFKVYQIGEQRLVSLNMAFACSLEGSSQDRGKLFFPMNAWELAASQLPDGKCLGVVHHFPLYDMDEAHQRALLPKIRHSATLTCFGHVHNADPANTSTNDTKTVHLQSGALYARSDDFKGYSITHIENDLLLSRFRTYFVGRQAFDAALNVGDNGLFSQTRNRDAIGYNASQVFRETN